MTRLEQLRKNALLTPEQLSDAIRHEFGDETVSARTIRNLEAGKGAHIRTLRVLSQFFSVPAGDLALPAIPSPQPPATEPERQAA